MKSISNTRISLHRFVDELTAGLLPMAVSRRSFIINEVDRQLELGVDENMLAYVLWNLINRVVRDTQNECIHVGSVSAGDRTMICVRNTGSCSYRNTSHGFRQVQYVAEKLGGSISIDYTEPYSTTVALTLQNAMSAA